MKLVNWVEKLKHTRCVNDARKYWFIPHSHPWRADATCWWIHVVRHHSPTCCCKITAGSKWAILAWTMQISHIPNLTFDFPFWACDLTPRTEKTDNKNVNDALLYFWHFSTVLFHVGKVKLKVIAAACQETNWSSVRLDPRDALHGCVCATGSACRWCTRDLWSGDDLVFITICSGFGWYSYYKSSLLY